jgi:hypothetical protein
MRKRIKRTSELPTWFQLDKYNSSKDLDASGWYEQLYIRERARFSIKIFGTLTNDNQQIFLNALALIRETPIVNVSSNELLERVFGSFPNQPLAELKNENPHFSTGIYPCTVQTLYETEKNILEEK